jgi:hypothetical protein
MMYGDSENLVATWKAGGREDGYCLIAYGRLEIFEMHGLGRGFIAAMACPLARWWVD